MRARASVERPLSARPIIVAALLFMQPHCGPSSTLRTAADAPCPTALPSASAPCTHEGLACGYLHCDAYGVGRARCTGGLWSVATSDCTPTECGGAGPCPVGTVCRTDVGGAVVSTCVPRPCTSDLVSCQCACGGECATNLPRLLPERPLGVACSSCTSGVCP